MKDQLAAAGVADPDARPSGAQRSEAPAVDADADAELDSGPPERTGETIGGWHLEAILGRGAMGEVYRARREAAGQLAALKLLRGGTQTARAELRFRREFRAIARLDHPNCIRVFEEGVHRGDRFMVTELANGDLRALVGRGETSELLSVLLQVASALDYVHAQRVVHRDIKPENILLFDGDPPVAKLADFGIAWLDPGLARPMTAAGKMMGTVDYIAPEQVRGEPADPRSDLYALGTLAFELFSGRMPFEGPMWKVLQARVMERAPPLAKVAPHAPAALCELADRLLLTDPRDRPQSAHVVALELGAILASEGGDGVAARVLAALPAPHAGGFLYRPPMVGRQRELDAIVALAERARSGDRAAPVAVALMAEAGAGKSALTRLVEQQLELRGMAVVTHMLSGDETRAPFAPFQAIEHDLARRAHGDTSGKGASEGSWLVAGRFSHEPRGTAQGRFLASDDAAAWRRRRAQRVLELMDKLPSAGGLALVIEDVHEMDGGAWALLGEVLDGLGGASGPRPFVVLSARPSAAAAIHTLVDTGRRVASVELGPLDEDAVAELAAAMLGCGVSALPDELVFRTLRECHGNPLLVQSYLLALVDSGDLRRVRGGWALTAGEPRLARVPPTMAAVLKARLGQLRERTLIVLGRAAAIGNTFDLELLMDAALGTDEGVVLDAIDQALRARIVETVGGGAGEREAFAFTHKRLAEVLYDDLAPDARRPAHDRIGARLLGRGDATPAALAHHFGAGSDDARALEWLGAAADESIAAHDHAASEQQLLRWLARAEAAGVPVAARLPRREALGDALLAQGKGAEARAALEALSAEAADQGGIDRVTRARWLRKEGLARLMAVDTAGGIAALEAALRVLGDRVPRSWLGVRMRIARELTLARFGPKAVLGPAPDERLEERMACHRWLGTLFRWVDLERTAAHNAAQLRLAERSGDLGHRTYAYAMHAVFWTFLGSPGRAAKVEARARKLADRSADDGVGAFVELMRAATTLLGTNPGGALERFDKAIGLARRAGDRFLEELTVSGRGWANTLLGRWRPADEDFAHALAVADALDIQWIRADAGVGRSLVQIAMGHLTEGVARARALVAEPGMGLPAVEALSTEILGGAEYIRGRYREAAELMATASRLYRKHHLNTGWGYLVHIEHSEALLWQVDRDGADTVPDLMAQLRRDARNTHADLHRIPMFAGFDRILAGVIASRRGKRQKALALFEQGLAMRPGSSEAYLDTWMAVRIAVERLRLGGPRAETVGALDKVAETFQSNGLAGMLSWLVQMRAELGI
ncbi:MAG: protein kinase [Myxococcota bacterium]